MRLVGLGVSLSFSLRSLVIISLVFQFQQRREHSAPIPEHSPDDLANAAAGALVMAQIGTFDQEWLRDWEKKKKEAFERRARSLVWKKRKAIAALADNDNSQLLPRLDARFSI